MALRPRRTGEANDLVRLYFEDLASHPLLTREDECQLAQRMEAGAAARAELDRGELDPGDPPDPGRAEALRQTVRDGEAARLEFINANLRLVVLLAKRYQTSGLPLLDLIQEGNLGIVHAVEKFDWRKGFKFSTYATWWIHQAIQRGISNSARTIRLPIHAGDRLRAIGALRRDLELDLGREPSDAELAGACGMAEAELAVLWRHSRPVRSLSELVTDGSSTELLELVVDSLAEDPAEQAARVMAGHELEALLDWLLPEERQVLVLRLGLDGGERHTTAEVATRLSMTTDAVRVLERRALAKLRHPAGGRDLAELLAG